MKLILQGKTFEWKKYKLYCVLAIDVINHITTPNKSEELTSDVFTLEELDIEWVYLFDITGDHLTMSIKINNCIEKVTATANVGGYINCITVSKGSLTKLYDNCDSNNFSISNHKHVHNNVFKITIKMVFAYSNVDHLTSSDDETSEDKKEYESYDHIFEDFGRLFNSPKYSDVTFVIGDKKLFAHKLLLFGKSAVFAEMFENEMKEENEVKIEDIKYEVFEEMIKFIYTNKSDKLPNMAGSLLAAADKYQLKDLLEACIKYLKKNLGESTVIEVIILAHLHGLNDLKRSCLMFIMENYDSIDTKSLYKYPQLLNEILDHSMRPKSD